MNWKLHALSGMRRTASTIVILFCVSVPAEGKDAGQILEAEGITGGVIVHLGCGDGTLEIEPVDDRADADQSAHRAPHQPSDASVGPSRRFEAGESGT